MTLSLAVIVILVGKFWPLGVADWVWPAAAVGLGTLAATGWAIATGRGTMDAAIEIDHRFGLKERVSSTLALSEEDRDSEAGQALIDGRHPPRQTDRRRRADEDLARTPGALPALSGRRSRSWSRCWSVRRWSTTRPKR